METVAVRGNENVLQCCLEHNIKSVAFCCISTGEFHFPNDKAAEIAWKTVSAFLERHSERMERIIFNVFKDSGLELYRKVFMWYLALDYVFLAGFHMGISGAAVATGLGYSVTAVVGLFVFSRKESLLHFRKPVCRFRVFASAAANGCSEMATARGDATFHGRLEAVRIK